MSMEQMENDERTKTGKDVSAPNSVDVMRTTDDLGFSAMCFIREFTRPGSNPASVVHTARQLNADIAKMAEVLNQLIDSYEGLR